MIAICAHRGGGEVAPRGSRDAYLTALDSGAEYVEFDVRNTSDGTYVVVHDERPDRMGPRVRELTYADLCARLGFEVLTVRDLMTRLAGHAVAHLDLKEAARAEPVADLAVEILGADGVVITTGSTRAVRAIKARHPGVRVAFSVGRSLNSGPLWTIPRMVWQMFFPIRRIKRCGADGIAVHHQIARAGVLRQAARADLFTMVWTVNNESRLRRMLVDPRIDVLITDRPRLARKLRDGG